MNHYFKGYRVKTGLAVFLKFIEACFELLLPLLMVSLINEGILLKNQSHVYKMAFIMVLLTVLGYLASITCQYYASIISQRVGGRIRSKLMSTILHLDKKTRDGYDDASLIMRTTSDIDRVIDMIAKTIRLAVRAPMIILGSVAAMYLLNPQLSMILLISIPIFTLIIALFMLLSVRYHRSVQTAWDRFSFKLREYLDGVRIIFAFNKASYEAEQLNHLNQDLSTSMNKMAFLNGFSSPFVAFLMNALLIFLVYQGAIKVDQGIMNQSQMLALINYCTQIVLTLIVFMNLVMIFSRGYGSWQRILEILDLDVYNREHGLKTIQNDKFELQFNDVSFSYPNQRHRVLSHLDFRVPSSSTLGIIGLTGSGKSTLLKLIANTYDVSEGAILLNGNGLNSYTLESLRESIGYIPQKPQFLSGVLRDAISLDKDVDVEKYLRLAQGGDILSKGLDAPVLKGANNFSGGQRQRINIARQWAKEPAVLMFDDSFSALDAITQQRLKEALKEDNENRTVIVASQRTRDIQDLDHILVLDQGRIVAQGSHGQLLEENALYQEIHRLDYSGGMS